jgi:2-C-methyl-D-erythritol 4-phosphate cytidylyltransferase / 2-C-methyl-D-erythritol 2,4-cyclodiphosphate synthase
VPELGIVVVAAGSGTRLGHSEPKAFVELRGRAILEHALEGVFDSVEPAQVVIVAPESRLAAARAIARRVAGPAEASVSVVVGGDTRQASVLAGLAVLDADVDVVLVHDAARALTPGTLVDRVVRAVRSTGGGVIPALPVSDTIKRVTDDVVRETVDRSALVHVQTPQGFPRAALDAAYAVASAEFTDDAAVFTENGGVVTTVEGDARAFKITTPWDLRRAENVLGARTGGLRTGLGVDVHAYDETSPLWLGGLYWSGEPGLSGHSDGDAVLHAICDALLSAAGLGDLGSRFGTADPRFRDAASEVFVKETLALVAGAGFAVVNVSVQVVAARPKIAPRRSELEAHLSELVGAPVTLGATTTDGLGFTGRAEGIAAIATALLSAS